MENFKPFLVEARAACGGLPGNLCITGKLAGLLVSGLRTTEAQQTLLLTRTTAGQFCTCRTVAWEPPQAGTGRKSALRGEETDM